MTGCNHWEDITSDSRLAQVTTYRIGQTYGIRPGVDILDEGQSILKWREERGLFIQPFDPWDQHRSSKAVKTTTDMHVRFTRALYQSNVESSYLWCYAMILDGPYAGKEANITFMSTGDGANNPVIPDPKYMYRESP
jgi:hypothetical protein